MPFKQRLNEILEGADVALIPLAKQHYVEHLGWSRWFYGGDEFPCVQLIWPDRSNIFPWEAGFELDFEGEQPDLSSGGWGQLNS